MGIKELKNKNKLQELDQLVQHALNDELENRSADKSVRRNRTSKVLEALSFVDNGELSSKIKQCNQRSLCGSLWCLRCRGTGATQTLKNNFERHELSNDLLNITGFVALVPFDEDAVRNSLENDQKNWRSITRNLKKFDEPKWIEVAYEFELVNNMFLQRSDGSDVKKKQMQQLLDRDRPGTPLTILVHYHGLTNLTNDELVEVFGTRYFVGDKKLYKTSDDHGLYVQSMYESKSVEYNIDKLSSYPFKTATNFKHTYSGRDTGKEEFTMEELGKLATLYQNIQGRQYRSLMRSASNK
jgi:hypothetical protein